MLSFDTAKRRLPAKECSSSSCRSRNTSRRCRLYSLANYRFYLSHSELYGRLTQFVCRELGMEAVHSNDSSAEIECVLARQAGRIHSLASGHLTRTFWCTCANKTLEGFQHETFQPSNAVCHNHRTSGFVAAGLCELNYQGGVQLPSCKRGISPTLYAQLGLTRPRVNRPNLYQQYHRVHRRTFWGGPCYTVLEKEATYVKQVLGIS